MKIFVFGSCRVSLTSYLKTHSIDYCPELLHSTKDVIQMLHIFKEPTLLSACEYPTLISQNYSKQIDNFNNRIYLDLFNNADVIIIELCTLRYFGDDVYYYQLNRYH